jgi:hypothetical protein
MRFFALLLCELLGYLLLLVVTNLLEKRIANTSKQEIRRGLVQGIEHVVNLRHIIEASRVSHALQLIKRWRGRWG